MSEILTLSAVLLVLVVTSAIAYRGRDRARAALRAALERGEIRDEEYAAHLRALDDAA